MHSLSQDTRASGHQIYFVIKGFAPFKPKADIFTARKRSLGQGNVFTRMCHSVHRGKGVSVAGEGSILGRPPPQTEITQYSKERAVHILLECFLLILENSVLATCTK